MRLAADSGARAGHQQSVSAAETERQIAAARSARAGVSQVNNGGMRCPQRRCGVAVKGGSSGRCARRVRVRCGSGARHAAGRCRGSQQCSAKPKQRLGCVLRRERGHGASAALETKESKRCAARSEAWRTSAALSSSNSSSSVAAAAAKRASVRCVGGNAAREAQGCVSRERSASSRKATRARRTHA